MNRDQLEHNLDRLGGDLSRWPEPLRIAAADLAERDAEAARLIDRALRLERSLAEATAPGPLDAAAIGRFAAGTRLPRRPTMLTFSPRIAAVAASMSIALFLAGFSAGMLAPPAAEDGGFAALLFGTGDGTGEWL